MMKLFKLSTQLNCFQEEKYQVQVVKTMAKKQEEAVCELCGREVQSLSRHHLIPREEGGRYGATADLCQPCHSTIHLTFTNRDLATEYNTIPALQKAEPLQKYLKWVRGKRIQRIANRRGKRR